MTETTIPLYPDNTAQCQCSIMEGRCDEHGAMMREIHALWNKPAPFDPAVGAACDIIRSLADGYGYPGSMIDLDTYDWSGVRDSSVEGVEAMWKAIHA